MHGATAEQIFRVTPVDFVLFINPTYYFSRELNQVRLRFNIHVYSPYNRKTGRFRPTYRRDYEYLSQSRGNILRPFLEGEKNAKINTTFDEHYDKAIEAMPEYKDVAVKSAIKTLALDPANKNKTFAQILESSYGHLITGKKGLENAKPGAARLEDGEVDMAKARTDQEYRRQVLNDPALRRKYNKGLEKRLNL